MDQTKFYDHVSGWIKSYRDADALEWLRKFIDNSDQPADIKQRLHTEIDLKKAAIKQCPLFSKPTDNDINEYLLDENGDPRIFTTRFSAICKVAELKIKGYDVELKPGSVFYRIIKKSEVDNINHSAA